MRRLILLLLFAAAPVWAAAKPADIAYLKALRDADLRVATIGERLAIANAGLCLRTEYRTGLVLHDLDQYSADLREAAQQVFGLQSGIGVEAVVAGSAAARAGIGADRALLSVDGQPVGQGDGQAGFGRMETLLDRIDEAVADGEMTVETRDHGVPVRVTIYAIKGCASRFQIVLGSSINAEADGRYLQVQGKMVDFVANDQELAAVMAHELSHNILDHRARLNAAGVDRGMLGALGRSTAMIRATEIEADRLSVYLLANAGYDPRAAVGFWDRLGAKTGYGILSDGSHLRRKPRVALFVRELAALDALRAKTPKGALLIPDFAKPPFAKLR